MFPQHTVPVFTLLLAFGTRRPYIPGRPKKLCFTTQNLAVKTVGARLSVVKQSFFVFPGQYGRSVTKANRNTVHVFYFLNINYSETAADMFFRIPEVVAYK